MIIRQKSDLSSFGEFVKVVVDIERKIMAAGCELHVDCADELLNDGSKNADLWGANVYTKDNRIDFVSLINIRPHADNRSMEIQDPQIKKEIESVIRTLIAL